ncbi:transmembrane protein 214-A-like [Dendronephthya gigantea]|uniref:transmembrane protein 214-A-like n=1 Tax=Dendronephthya gigantea TaxID=151771 RepID=UPI00106BBAB4|nr:transmembrane protein 214-A-like [Dendronephthya gigantea]
MASNPGKWEVVGKDGKARKNAGNKKNKSKVNEADLPKLDIKAPIPESKTQFDAFSKKEPETVPFAIPKQESSDESDSRSNVRSQDRSRKMDKKHKHHREAHPTFNEIFVETLKKCDLVRVQNFISECRLDGLGLLKELAGFFQENFTKMPVEKDPVLGSQSPDFPLGFLDNNVQDLIIAEIKRCDGADVKRFFSYCLDELLIEINKGHASYGIRIMFQSILKCYPYFTLKKKKKECQQRVLSKKDNPREALSLLWACGQTSDSKNLAERMTMWSVFFLPVIESKQMSKYAIDYLETTLSLELPDRLTETPISGKRFQHIMELTYGSNFLQFPYRKQLQLLYPEIKAIMFSAGQPNSLNSVFTQIFDSLNAELGQEYLQEALSCLIKCLEKDATCHHKWRNNYLARIKESSLLLKAIVEQWDSICRSIPRKYLVETLREFQNVNNELKEREKPKAVLLDCESSCKKLLDVISTTPRNILISGPSRLTRIFKLLLFILFIVVSVDMYKSNGYQKSKTSNVLKQYGVEKVLVNGYHHAYYGARRMEIWAEKNYPYYYKKVQGVVEPASDYAMTKLGEGLYYIADVTAPVRQYIHKTVPPILEKFERFLTYYFNLVSKILINLWNVYSPIIQQYSRSAWNTLATWVPRVFSRAKDLAWKAAAWFYNLSPDFFDVIADGFRRLANYVVTTTPHILELVQEYLSTAWALLVSCFSDVILWLKTNVISAR